MDLTGEERYDLYVKEVDTSRVTQLTKLGTTSGSMGWALDNSTLLYVTLVGTCKYWLFLLVHLHRHAWQVLAPGASVTG